ncbi:MAG: NifU family protein [Bacilli bacterium]|jgi:Fe-S cluster biogenesis protein NfuA|nr:NifU family protein [Bacilli bacterium]
MKENEAKIIEIINRLRPFLVNDGGNIEFIKYENNIVYIKMMGACSNCHMLDLTLKDGIEAAIKEEVPEVIEVINVKDEVSDL